MGAEKTSLFVYAFQQNWATLKDVFSRLKKREKERERDVVRQHVRVYGRQYLRTRELLTLVRTWCVDVEFVVF